MRLLFYRTVTFYKEKQKQLTGSEADYVHAAKISPAEGSCLAPVS